MATICHGGCSDTICHGGFCIQKNIIVLLNGSIIKGYLHESKSFSPPSEKYDFVSWDHYSQYMERHKIPWFQSPPTSDYQPLLTIINHH